jgi:hypothetical protein
MVTEETCLTGPTSRCCPGWEWNRRPSPFRGFRCPLPMVWRPTRTRVGSTISRSWHRPYRTVSYSGGDGLAGRVGGTTSGHDSQACQRLGADLSLTWVPACVRTLKTLVGGAGTGAASPWEPRARRRLAREGVPPQSEAEPCSRGRPVLEWGGVPSARGRAPQAKWSLSRGWLGATVLVGRWGL